MSVIGLMAIVPLMLAIGFGPGLFVVRRLHWAPLETLTASIALSLTGLFVATFVAFWLDAPGWVDSAILAAAAALTAAVWRDARDLWREPVVRRAVLALLVLDVWTILLLSLILQYGGGNSCCDWLEHYQRTQHFIAPWPDDFLYIGRYLFPARPPLMNAVAAYVLGWVGPHFPFFQIVFSLLNVLALLACCLVSGVVSPTGRPADPRLIAVMLGANPMFFVNTTFPWTKVLTAFMVLLALALYVEGWRRADRNRMMGAFLALAAAILTHYSAAPYVFVLGLHYLTVVAPEKPVRRRDIAHAVLPGLALVALWIAYVMTEYGIDGLVRNVSLEGTQSRSALEHVWTRVLNLSDTFLPRLYTGYNGYPEIVTTWRWMSDQIFTLYQSNAVVSIGSISGVMAVGLAWLTFRRSPWTAECRFWTMLLPVICVLGVVIHGDREETGLAMIALQPVTYLALAFLATRLGGLPMWARRLWVAGTLVDAGLGITSALRFEVTTGEWARTPNWAIKVDADVLFLGDHLQTAAVPLVLLGLMACAVMAARVVARQITTSTVVLPAAKPVTD